MTEAPKIVAFGQSRWCGGHTFAMSSANGKIVSWRIDGEEVSEAVFKEALEREGMTLKEGMISLS